MCEPATIFVALTAASGVAKTIGQKQQADAQYDYQEGVIVSNKVAAMQQMADIRQRESQEAEAISRKQLEATIEGKRARSTATVAAGDSGASGQSVDALLNDMAMQEGRYKEALGRQKDFISTGADLNVESIKTGTANNNIRTGQPVAQPNYLANALQIGADIFGALGGGGGGGSGGGGSALNGVGYNTPLATTSASTTMAKSYGKFGGGGGSMIS